MSKKLLSFLLIITSLTGYLEWGGNNHAFLFQAERDIISQLISQPSNMLHPFILLPLFGQAILAITLFQKSPGRSLTYLGIGCIGVLFVFMLTVGILSLNLKIILSTIPFFVVAVLAFGKHRRKN